MQRAANRCRYLMLQNPITAANITQKQLEFKSMIAHVLLDVRAHKPEFNAAELDNYMQVIGQLLDSCVEILSFVALSFIIMDSHNG